jgi:hypothetical protein
LEALKVANYRDVIIFAAAGGMDGGNTQMTFPANRHDLVIPISATDGLGRLAAFNAIPNGFALNIATLGILDARPREDGIQRAGLVTAAAIGTGIAATIMHYVRLVGRKENLQIRDRWDLVRVFQLQYMATKVGGFYVLTPWEFWARKKKLVDMLLLDTLR